MDSKPLRVLLPHIAPLYSMNSLSKEFSSMGFVVLRAVAPSRLLTQASIELEALSDSSAGTRNVLQAPWCIDLAKAIRAHLTEQYLLSPNFVATQCTYFHKAQDNNWLVPLHRDKFIPVAARCEVDGWSGWSEKEGVLYCRPPAAVMAEMVAVRLHLEANTPLNGPLHVVPGSHVEESVGGQRHECLVPKGGALVLRPSLLHASSKLKSGCRRVLHFLFGPAVLPNGIQWAHAV